MLKHHDAFGFTLTELIICMGVVSILSMLALPSISNMLTRSQGTAGINRLVGAVNYTRHAAVQFAVTATLCPLKLNGKCGGNWAGVLTVFADRNKNAVLDNTEDIFTRIAALDKSTTVKWRSFQNRQYLQMLPFGYTNFQNGNFTVCPISADAKMARQIIINIQGRVRRNHSVNEAGYPIDRKGKVLRC